jgi:outer membrane protein OmpA-like peptidoglycan-associated protein
MCPHKPIRNASFILLVLLIGITSPLNAQKKLVRMADRYYSHLQFASAIPFYADALKADPKNTEVLIKLADCYKRTNNSVKQEETYRLLEEGSAAQKNILLQYAQALAQNGKYQESHQRYEQYTKMAEADNRGRKHTKALTNLPDFYKDSADVDLQFLSLNTDYEEFSPAFYKNGIVFCSGRPSSGPQKIIFGWNNASFLDLYFSPNAKWAGANDSIDEQSLPAAMAGAGAIKLPGDVNSIYHEGPLVFFALGDSMIFTRNNYHEKEYKTDKSGVNRLKLYSARRIGDQWTEIKSLSINNNEYSVGHPALSRDEKTLYFVSDMPGGKGDTDIWYVPITNGQLGSPVNAGSEINTAGREMFPFVDVDDNLFYASDGHGGLGGLDIFYSKIEEKKFQEPVNLGYPINSSKDDFGLIVSEDHRTGYLSSFRKGEKSNDDIYAFTSKGPLIKSYSLTGVVVELATMGLLPGTDVILSDEKGKEVGRMTTGDAATFTFPVELKKTYSLYTEKEKFTPNAIKISTDKISSGTPMKVVLPLEKIVDYGLYFLITDKKTGKPIDSVHAVVIDVKKGTQGLKIAASANGDFRLALPTVKKGDKVHYTLQLDRKGYLAKTVYFSYQFIEPGDGVMHKSLDLALEKIEVGADIGKILRVKPIYFDMNKYIIRKDAATELDKIVEVMTENPGMKIELGSHTDARGSDASNLALSDRRAKASVAYIVSKGIEASRITGKGYGETKLTNACGNNITCSEADHQMNRRTEFIILSLGN